MQTVEGLLKRKAELEQELARRKNTQLRGAFENPQPFFIDKKRLMFGKQWYLDYYKFTDADNLFEECKKLELRKRPEIKGTPARCNRDVGVYSDVAKGYHLSKQSDYILPADPMPGFLTNLLGNINSHFDENYNLFLINAYEQRDSIGPHYDDPYGNGLHGIVTISLGATRVYRLISRESGKTVMNCEMKHGDVLVMSNEFQSLYEHAVPPSETDCGLRISLTTRCIVESRTFRHKRPRLTQWKPSEPKFCLSCNKRTSAKSQVCPDCFDLNKFECPKCKTPVGAPWLCSICWIEKKHPVEK